MEAVGDGHVASQRRPHGEVVVHGGDVVHAQDGCTRIDPGADGGQRAGVALARRALRESTDEVLARDGEQHRVAKRHDRRQVTQHGHGLGGRLGEVGTRVEHDALLGHATIEGVGHAVA